MCCLKIKSGHLLEKHKIFPSFFALSQHVQIIMSHWLEPILILTSDLLLFALFHVQLYLWGVQGHCRLASGPDRRPTYGGHRVRVRPRRAGWHVKGPGGLQLQGHPQLPPEHRWVDASTHISVCRLLRLTRLTLTNRLCFSLQCMDMQDGWCLAHWRDGHVFACRGASTCMRAIQSRRCVCVIHNN